MRRLSLIAILVALLIGCTNYKVVNQIHPKVSVIGDTVGLVYKLGNLTVSDTWEDVEEEKIAFLQTQKDLVFMLNIIKEEGQYSTTKYYVNGILFKEHNKQFLSDDLILSQKDKIDGFFLFKLNGNEVSEENKEIIEKKLEDIKQEVKKSGKFEIENKY